MPGIHERVEEILLIEFHLFGNSLLAVDMVQPDEIGLLEARSIEHDPVIGYGVFKNIAVLVDIRPRLSEEGGIFYIYRLIRVFVTKIARQQLHHIAARAIANQEQHCPKPGLADPAADLRWHRQLVVLRSLGLGGDAGRLRRNLVIAALRTPTTARLGRRSWRSYPPSIGWNWCGEA